MNNSKSIINRTYYSEIKPHDFQIHKQYFDTTYQPKNAVPRT